MHALDMLQQRLRSSCPQIHLRRLQALLACVLATVCAQRLTMTELGRAMPGSAHAKHGIKRVDRLTGNPHLAAECVEIYRTLARWIVGNSRQPLIIIDWSDLSSDRRWQLLRAAIPIGGRTLTVYEEVHPLRRLANPEVHRAFLQQLKDLLPGAAVPIVVTDAGFRTPWFGAVSAMGWHWIGRIRNRELVRAVDTCLWVRAKALYDKASTRARGLGQHELARSVHLSCRLYLVKRRKKHRVLKSVYGKPIRGAASQARARMHREPWLLATSCSLASVSAETIVNFYAQRMQIEEAFRDLKSDRYGLGFELSMSRDRRRIAALLLIAALALLVLWLVGSAAAAAGLQRSYQSNTRQTRAVLSTFTLACLFVRHQLYSSPPRLVSCCPDSELNLLLDNV